MAGDQVDEAIACPIHPQPVSIHLLWMRGEIRHYEESLTAAVTDVAEEMPVAGLDELCVTIVKRRLLLTQRDQPHQLREYVAMRRVRVMLYPLLPAQFVFVRWTQRLSPALCGSWANEYSFSVATSSPR